MTDANKLVPVSVWVWGQHWTTDDRVYCDPDRSEIGSSELYVRESLHS